MNHNMKIGIMSIVDSISNPASLSFENLYNSIGLNTGNLMFTNAVLKQLKGNIQRIGFSFNPYQINNDFDVLVIPAANWINSYSDWDWLSDLLEKITMPVVTIGIGVQANSNDIKSIQVNSSCMRLAKLLSSKANYISVRGNFTRDWFIDNGMKNVVTTGCPSMYMRFEKREGSTNSINNVVIQSTRYYISSDFLKNYSENRELYKIAATNNFDMVYQSEPEEINYLVYGDEHHNKSNLELRVPLVKLYGLPGPAELKDFLRQHGKAFFSIEDWADYLSNKTGVIGTRLHVTILALNLGLPAVLIPHDSRTQEMAEFAAIPTAGLELINKKIIEGVLFDYLKTLDIGNYLKQRKKNSLIYQEFLLANNLEFNKDQILD